MSGGTQRRIERERIERGLRAALYANTPNIATEKVTRQLARMHTRASRKKKVAEARVALRKTLRKLLEQKWANNPNTGRVTDIIVANKKRLWRE